MSLNEKQERMCTESRWDFSDLKAVFLNSMIPLLQEYFYSDWEKVCAVLGCPYETDESDTPTYAHAIISGGVVKESAVLGFNHPEYADQWRYAVNPAFINATGTGLAPYFKSVFRG